MEKYIEIFNKLWEHSENEVVEFKKAETNFDIDELGKYFSALIQVSERVFSPSTSAARISTGRAGSRTLRRSVRRQPLVIEL